MIARHPRRTAVAAVEFAILAPILLLFAFACVDFGRALGIRSIVCNAARSGATYGASHQFTEFSRGSWEQQVQAAIADEFASLPPIETGPIESNLTVNEVSSGFHYVRIDVGYLFTPIVAWPGIPSEVNIRHHVEFKQFR
ncbi:pilus assembly protein [Stieleria sp. JC731]|uniref:TadE/TadG family type IV pilus assembly protein n=1 Tax=Pirellulaceae TaxID=2691357 RepID=UPI001E64519B|nr:TadE/TadG family type IV pilus assembly protein [Stieleria sp. JC731]MCC9601693.1 pilus assembly protein [Stieleria sp. JC731]